MYEKRRAERESKQAALAHDDIITLICTLSGKLLRVLSVRSSDRADHLCICRAIEIRSRRRLCQSDSTSDHKCLPRRGTKGKLLLFSFSHSRSPSFSLRSFFRLLSSSSFFTLYLFLSLSLSLSLSHCLSVFCCFVGSAKTRSSHAADRRHMFFSNFTFPLCRLPALKR
jgi:hypothetical protein